jgi:hypothetical protein
LLTPPPVSLLPKPAKLKFAKFKPASSTHPLLTPA